MSESTETKETVGGMEGTIKVEEIVRDMDGTVKVESKEYIESKDNWGYGTGGYFVGKEGVNDQVCTI